MKTTLSALFVLLASVAPALGDPDLRSIRPPGGQRGTEVEVTFSGRNLADAQEILWYEPGIEAVEFTKVNDNTAKAKLKIAPDARLGLYDLRVRTLQGVTRLGTFSVGQFPETQEKEPNNDFETPQPIGMNVLVNGVAEREDIDYFVVEAKKGERITAEVEGLRLGIFHFDPYVAILDSKRFELSSSDDAPLLGVDALAQIEAPEDGPYIIAVRESAYAGN
ncbi:MAG TPA: PPC domain-containing protein, partial [Isosphaeraceae bacterium]|nr:PPC domain-containing protein [Isosphaeraceae bacterium]